MPLPIQVIENAFADLTRAAILAVIATDPAAFSEALGIAYGRVEVIEGEYPLTDADINAALAVSADSVIVLPEAPGKAMNVLLQGEVLSFECATDYTLVAPTGEQIQMDGGTPATIAPLSPALAIAQVCFIGDRWFIFQKNL